MQNKRACPWKDYVGNGLIEGDTIVHPSGEAGVIVFDEEIEDDARKWQVEYSDNTRSSLFLQIGEKGQAVKKVYSVIEPVFSKDLAEKQAESLCLKAAMFCSRKNMECVWVNNEDMCRVPSVMVGGNEVGIEDECITCGKTLEEALNQSCGQNNRK